jgi:hypothetical protein
LSAAEKIGHCRYCLSRAFGAGANGKDEVAEGKFFWGLKDLFVLFHTVSPHFSANLVPPGLLFTA